MLRSLAVYLFVVGFVLASVVAGGMPIRVEKSSSVVGGTCLPCESNTQSKKCDTAECGYWHQCLGTTGSGNCVDYTYCNSGGKACGDATRQVSKDCQVQ
jgi:hypothetical protein